MQPELNGRNAILTGASKGMGPVIARFLAEAGADLVLFGRDLPAMESVAEDVRALERRALVVSCDVSDPASVTAAVQHASDFFGGRIDILVNGAGGTGPVEVSTIDTTPEAFDEVMAVNMRGVFLTIRAVLPTMMQQKFGKIVNIGGTWGLRGKALRMAYGATKWGLRGISKSVALEAGPYNINVNDVCPGIVEGPRVEHTLQVKAKKSGKTIDQIREESAADYALRRFSQPEDVANVVVFLCSEKSRQITGQDIAVDGGWVI